MANEARSAGLAIIISYPTSASGIITGLPVRPSHKMGFRSSVSKSGLPGEGRHEGLVPRNDSHKWFYMSFSCTAPCTDTFCTLSALPLKNPQGVANLKKAICVVRSDSTMRVTL